MTTDQSGETLPDELVERIIAMMPFPQIFKARCLSKAWLGRFASVVSQDDEVKKDLALGFQKQVAKWCSKWATFGPLVEVSNEGLLASGSPAARLLAYSPAACNWCTMPSFNPSRNDTRLQLEGALLYGFGNRAVQELFVMNILTRDKRVLPPRPNKNTTIVLCLKLITDELSGTYKVIMACQDHTRDEFGKTCFSGYSAQIYNSKSNAWISKKLRLSYRWLKSCECMSDMDNADSFSVSSGCLKCLNETDHLSTAASFTIRRNLGDQDSAAYVNGVLYYSEFENPRHILAINPEDGTVEALEMRFPYEVCEEVIEPWERVIYSLHLKVCKGDLFMILITDGYVDVNCERIRLLKFDLESQRLSEVAEHEAHVFFCKPVSDGNLILMGTDHQSQYLACNLDEEKWSRFPVPRIKKSHVDELPDNFPWWHPFVFRPSLNKFVPWWHPFVFRPSLNTFVAA